MVLQGATDQAEDIAIEEVDIYVQYFYTECWRLNELHKIFL